MMNELTPLLKSILIRSIGVVMAFGFGGAGIGALSPIGWFWGMVAGVGTVFSGIIVFFGVMLIWNARLTLADIEKGFRAAVAQQAEDNPDIAQAIATATDDEINWDDFGSDDDPELND